MWEYKIQQYKHELSEEELNKFGVEGWELVSYLTNYDFAYIHRYIFKRIKGK